MPGKNRNCGNLTPQTQHRASQGQKLFSVYCTIKINNFLINPLGGGGGDESLAALQTPNENNISPPTTDQSLAALANQQQTPIAEQMLASLANQQQPTTVASGSNIASPIQIQVDLSNQDLLCIYFIYKRFLNFRQFLYTFYKVLSL